MNLLQRLTDGRSSAIKTVDELVKRLVEENWESAKFLMDKKSCRPLLRWDGLKKRRLMFAVEVAFTVEHSSGEQMQVRYNRGFGYLESENAYAIVHNLTDINSEEWGGLFYAQSILAFYEFVNQVMSKKAQALQAYVFIAREHVLNAAEKISDAKRICQQCQDRGFYIPLNQPFS